MILTVARHELIGLRRDRRYRLAVAFIVLLMTVSTGFGWLHFSHLTAQAKLAAEHDYERWLGQDPTNPHVAAHFGSYAFKTPRPLTLIDPGIQPYTGAALFYGAHQPHEMEFPPAQDATALQRFGELGVSDSVRVLLPLLVILLAFGGFAGEREQGTLRQLLSIGVHPSALLWGKTLGIALAMLAVLVPAGLCGLIATGGLATQAGLTDELSRAGILLLAYAVYLGIFLFMTLAISAHVRKARSVLVIMLVFWLITAFALPRGLLDLGATRHPSPGPEFAREFIDAVNKASEEGGGQALDAALAQYHIKNGDIGQLPFDITGLYMKAADAGGYAVIDDYFKRRFAAYDDQNNYLILGSILSPAAGLNLLSMALTGNDANQHREFVQQVENQRRTLNNVMTQFMLNNNKKGQNFDDLKGDKGLWETVPPFRYQPLGWANALMPYHFSIAALVCWLVFSLAYARFAIARLKLD